MADENYLDRNVNILQRSAVKKGIGRYLCQIIILIRSIRKIYRSSKARAFHHFRDSFRIYNKYYLKTNALQDKIFDVCWYLGYLERVVYDRLKEFT